MPVDPTLDDLERFITEDQGGPVVMLNLLKLKDGGLASYQAYAEKVVPFLAELGAEVLYVGECSTVLVAPEEHDWDLILLVRYPSRQAFGLMVANPDYLQITSLRTEALSNAVLQATTPVGELAADRASPG